MNDLMTARPAAPVRAPARLRDATPAERADWDALVTRFRNGRVVHRRAWLESLEACGFGRARYLVFEREGEIAGVLPGLVTRLGPLRIFGSPLAGWQSVSMGPAFDPARIDTGEMMRLAVAHLERREGVHHVEIIHHELDPAAMAAHGFHGTPMPTFRMALTPGEEGATLRRMKESARRNVRRAEKLGLVVEFEDGDAFVDEHFAQLREVWLRGGNVIPFGPARVRAYVRHMRDAGLLLAASVRRPDTGARIATATFTADGRELLLWMWAHDPRERWYRATELMTWAIMQRAMRGGCESLDFMGRGDFKARFGATLDESKHRWVRSRYRWLAAARQAAERGYRW